MINSMAKLTDELMNLCNCRPIKEVKVLHISKDFSPLKDMFNNGGTARSILIPLQESLTANLPPSSASESSHKPFPIDAPSFTCKHVYC